MSKLKKIWLIVKECVKHPELIVAGLRVIKNNGIRVFIGNTLGYVDYQIGQNDLKKEIEVKYNGEIKFSIVMPVYNVEIQWLEKAINSVKNQNYTNWELCMVDDCSTDPKVREYLETITDENIYIKFAEQNKGISEATNDAATMATGDYIVLMDNDDEITFNALHEFYKEAHRSGADIIYSDQDIVDLLGNRRDPMFKPDWSPDLFLSQMYIGHLLGFKKELFEKVGGFRTEFNGSQDYDLVLRMIEHTNNIKHISKVLYSWRAIPSSTAANPDSKPYAQTAGLHAIQEHLDRVYRKGTAIVNETENLFVYDVRYSLKEKVKVSVIIPTKDHVDLLEKMVQSILDKTTYPNYEVIILNNNSEEQETYTYFDRIQKEYKKVKVIEAFFEFNWSKLNNYGMKHADGDVFIFANNDMEVISAEWMERLTEKALREDVGVVGGLLLYEDGTIQHAGVIAGMGGWAEHVFKGMQPVHYGSPFVSPMVTRNITACTGACMAIAKKTIEKIGVFDDEFIICGSDVEICVRANEHGLVNIYDPYVKLYHYESKSRDSYIPEIDFKLSDKMYAKYREYGDPYYNNRLDYYSYQPTIKQDAYTQCYFGEKKAEAPVIEFLKEEESNLPELDTRVHEIVPYTFRKSVYPRKRMNILVPSINAEHVFGGISTALKFFSELVEETGYDQRIILVDAEPNKEARNQYKGYLFVEAEDECLEDKQILPYSNRFGRSMPVSENDYFVFTGWWTAHCAQEAYETFEAKEQIKPNPFVYLIQDYEPGFYPWSTRYLLAEATYKSDYPTIAVFNSFLLKDYFDKNGYTFFKSFAFDPVLNQSLKSKLDELPKQLKKKKQILLYGRPGTERNAFNLLVAALEKWVWMQYDIDEWTILSAGEKHRTVNLGNGKKIVSVGKLTLDEYANMLAESYAGISLMASPHPSYPPLEMATFGIKVITNTFSNKDLKEFNPNIVSLDNTSPSNIAKKLVEICDGYSSVVEQKVQNEAYCENKDVFAFVKEIKNILENN